MIAVRMFGFPCGSYDLLVMCLLVIRSYSSCFCLLHSKVQNDEKMSAYKDFCKSIESKELEMCLMNDLKVSERWHNQNSG